MRYEPWDVTNQPDRVNIERIVEYLGQLREGGFGLVPADALDAIVGLLARVEVAERNLEQLRARTRQGGQRQAVEEISYVCRVCGATVVREHLVGAFRPSVCGAERCRREARQADARERQRRFRQHHAARKGEKTD
ncbi:MAG: hypothetical protein M3380_18040 [Chloroflexota bacterium]|nr:hypothetical protein [Chloroflexota bacterium]